MGPFGNSQAALAKATSQREPEPNQKTDENAERKTDDDEQAGRWHHWHLPPLPQVIVWVCFGGFGHPSWAGENVVMSHGDNSVNL